MSSFGIHPISQSWGFPLEPSRQARYLYNPQSVIKYGGPLGNPQNNRHVIIIIYIYTYILVYIYGKRMSALLGDFPTSHRS